MDDITDDDKSLPISVSGGLPEQHRKHTTSSSGQRLTTSIRVDTGLAVMLPNKESHPVPRTYFDRSSEGVFPLCLGQRTMMVCLKGCRLQLCFKISALLKSAVLLNKSFHTMVRKNLCTRISESCCNTRPLLRLF